MLKKLVNGLFISGKLKGLIRKSKNQNKERKRSPTTGQLKEKI